jgi:hypothetical protein
MRVAMPALGSSQSCRIRTLLAAFTIGFCWTAIVPGRTSAQIVEDSLASRVAWRLGVNVAVGHNSPVTNQLGTTPDRDHLLVAMSAATSIIGAGAFHVYYDCQVLPVVLIRGNAPPEGYHFPAPGGTVPGNDVAYAFGISPFGIELQGSLSKALTIYAATAAGGLWFDREYPIPGAGRIDFTLEFGAGMFIALGKESWLQVGYKYHHLSNANSAAQNPGVDANLVYVGYDWAVFARR